MPAITSGSTSVTQPRSPAEPSSVVTRHGCGRSAWPPARRTAGPRWRRPSTKSTRQPRVAQRVGQRRTAGRCRSRRRPARSRPASRGSGNGRPERADDVERVAGAALGQPRGARPRARRRRSRRCRRSSAALTSWIENARRSGRTSPARRRPARRTGRGGPARRCRARPGSARGRRRPGGSRAPARHLHRGTGRLTCADAPIGPSPCRRWAAAPGASVRRGRPGRAPRCPARAAASPAPW